MDQVQTVQYSSLCHNLVGKARNSVRDIDSTDELTFMRMRTKRHEIMIAPGDVAAALLNPFSPGTDFRRQNLLKWIPTLKELNIY